MQARRQRGRGRKGREQQGREREWGRRNLGNQFGTAEVKGSTVLLKVIASSPPVHQLLHCLHQKKVKKKSSSRARLEPALSTRSCTTASTRKSDASGTGRRVRRVKWWPIWHGVRRGNGDECVLHAWSPVCPGMVPPPARLLAHLQRLWHTSSASKPHVIWLSSREPMRAKQKAHAREAKEHARYLDRLI